MFSHLVESDLHKGELKRRGTFFMATLGAYALLLAATGLTGVYAYEAHIDDQNLELVALVPPDTEVTKPRETPPERPVNTTPSTSADGGGSRNRGGAPEAIRSNTSSDPTKISGPPQPSTTQDPPSIPQGNGRTYIFGTEPYNPNGKGGDDSSSNTNGKGGDIVKEEPPPIVKKTPEKPKNTIRNIGVANSMALSLPEPVYPQLARTAGIQGQVNVEIMIDETGRVISARATNGNPLLRQEAERAAFRARFTPTRLSEQPVKAKGIITYNFVLKR